MTGITGKTTLHDALKANPAAASLFDSYGMGCKSCSAGKTETLEWGAIMHGVEVSELLEKLNAQAKTRKKKQA